VKNLLLIRNWLKFAAIVVNYAGVIVTAQNGHPVPPFPSMIQLNGDNKTGNKVTAKGTLKSDSKIACAVSWILSKLQCQTIYGLTCSHIEGKTNNFADDFSHHKEGVWLDNFCEYNAVQLNLYLHPQENVQSILMVGYQQYHPSPELLSANTTAIFESRKITISLQLKLNNLGHLSQGCNCPTDKIAGIRFTLHFQKNCQHGQKVTHAANQEPPK
jgi:hypothetical protein